MFWALLCTNVYWTIKSFMSGDTIEWLGMVILTVWMVVRLVKDLLRYR